MKKRARRNHTPTFKAKVALAGLKNDRTIAQLAEQFDVHPNQISLWKEQLLAGAADVFERGGNSKSSASEVDVKSLHAKIGELVLENDFLERALGKAGFLSAKAMIDRNHGLALTKQSALLGMPGQRLLRTGARLEAGVAHPGRWGI